MCSKMTRSPSCWDIPLQDKEEVTAPCTSRWEDGAEQLADNSGYWRPRMVPLRACLWEGLLRLWTLATSFLSVPSPSLSSPPTHLPLLQPSRPLFLSLRLFSIPRQLQRGYIHFFFSELKLLLSERHTFMQTVFQIRFIKREVHLSNVYYTQKTDYWNGAVNLVTRLNTLITC